MFLANSSLVPPIEVRKMPPPTKGIAKSRLPVFSARIIEF